MADSLSLRQCLRKRGLDDPSEGIRTFMQSHSLNSARALCKSDIGYQPTGSPAVDLVSFRTVRSAQRAEPEGEDVLPPLTFDGATDVDNVEAATEVDGATEVNNVEAATNGPLLNRLLAIVANDELTQDQKVAAARSEAEQFGQHAEDQPVDPDTITRSRPEGEWRPGDRELWLIGMLDQWLTLKDNRTDPAELEAVLRKLLELIDISIDSGDWFEAHFARAWSRLMDTLAAALLLPSRGELARRLTRLLLVGGLVQRRAELGKRFDSSDQVQRLLRNRTPLLPSPPFPDLLPAQQVQLVRQATVSDMFVVRSEWRCYQAGEVADIRNVMAGEELEHRTLQIDEREVTETTETERIAVEERTDETTERSDLSEETSREVKLALHAEGQVDTSGQYGPTKVDTHVGGSVDFSRQDATQRATQLAREAVSRAVARIETRTRTERVERLLTRFEDATTHSFSAGGEHVRGVYRWVERINRLQVFRYPDRFQLEFQLPEPGRFLREQLRRPLQEPTIDYPGDLPPPASTINKSNYAQLAKQYQVEGVQAPPEQTLAMTDSISVDPPDMEIDGDSDNIPYNPKPVFNRAEISLPTGYAAKKATVSVHAAPLRAQWEREELDSNTSNDQKGFHTISVTLAVGDKRWTTNQMGPDPGNKNAVQSDGDKDHHVQYLDADLEWSAADQVLDPGILTKVPVTLAAVGANSATASVELVCNLTEEAMAQWRQDTFDTLLTAYKDQLREYRAEQARLGIMANTVYERSPARNAEMIRNELKRHVISWLLGESPFPGRKALLDMNGKGDIDLPKALSTAGDIQFLEQAFEWLNLTYVPYPYYWADRGKWDEIMDIETVDSDLGQFLRCGSARVVLPARPGFADAVQHWLLFRQPWEGGPSPVPDDPLYVSVATEIRDLSQPPADGEPGESWEVRLPTTLRWLDTSDELPYNEHARLGAEPNAPVNPLCDDNAP